MQGFYEDMAEFAAMSESEGFLGQCASDFADPLPGDGRTSAPQRPRQLQLLVIEKSPIVVTKAG